MEKLTFEGDAYTLQDSMRQIFGNTPLEDVHTLLGDLQIPCVEFVGDQQLIYHKVAYANIRWEFMEAYQAFVQYEIAPLFNEPILYQKIPTLRFQLPDNKGVGAFHRDADYGHSPDEINFYVPLTACQDSSTIWTESTPGKKDYAPFEPMVYGDMMRWNGANLMHGNKINRTGKTRVSFDFRVLPVRLYDEADGMSRKTTHVGKRFIIGDYFERVE